MDGTCYDCLYSLEELEQIKKRERSSPSSQRNGSAHMSYHVKRDPMVLDQEKEGISLHKWLGILKMHILCISCHCVDQITEVERLGCAGHRLSTMATGKISISICPSRLLVEMRGYVLLISTQHGSDS